MRYALTLFTQDGRSDFCLNLDRETALEMAASMRPERGASYVHDETRRLTFKPYRMGQPSLRPRPNSTRRLNAKQIEAAACRMDEEGEHENAANMRALARPRTPAFTGTEGQDRESYSDDQDRSNYT